VQTWQARRDPILAREEHAGKLREEWRIFFVALADEQAARAHAATAIAVTWGLDPKELLSALAAAGAPFEPPPPPPPRKPAKEKLTF